MRVNLTLQQLEAFLQVATTCNFRLAAEALHVSQPALSRTVRMAEQALKTRLFDRDTRHVEITPAGRELLPIARRILDEFDSAFSELAQFLEGRSGQVTMAALPSVGVALVPAAIAAFRARQPEVAFNLSEAPAEPLLNAVNEGLVDFAITVEPAPDRRLRYTHLFDDPFVLVCRRGDPLASHASASWSVFADHPFLASAFQSSIRPVTNAVFLQKGLQIRPAFEYPSVAAGGAMVAQGLGIMALPRLALQLIPTGALAVVPLQRPVIARRIGVVTRIGRSLSPVCSAFIESLPAQLAPAAAARRPRARE